MLKTIHRYNKSVTLVIILSTACFALTGIGLGVLRQSGGKSGIAAITVGKEEVGYDEFQRERRSIEERFRSQYGPQYTALIQAMGINLSQLTVDQLISTALLRTVGAELGMHVSRAQVADTIKSRIFGGRFNPAQYESFLAQSGQTSTEFEDKLRSDLLQDTVRALILDVSIPSKAEARARVLRDDTGYDVEYVEFDPKVFESNMTAPGDTELRSYYQQHSGDFLLPERVVYDYVSFDPVSFYGMVEISKASIEQYYQQNKAKYSSPEEVKVRHIQKLYPSGATAEQKAEIKKKFEEAHTKAAAGEDFEALVKQYSDDYATNMTGGDLGWISRNGKFSKVFEDAAFNKKDGGISEVVDAGYGLHILRVDSYRAARPKSIEEVRLEIEEEIKKVEAPAYAATEARKFFEEWKKSFNTLPEFALKMGLTPSSSSGYRDASSDPEDTVKGLTAKILDPSNRSETKLKVDLDGKIIIVGVTSREAPSQAAYEDVVNKVADKYKAAEAEKQLSRGITILIESLKSGVQSDLKAAARASKFEVREELDLKPGKPGTGIFTDKEIRESVFSVSSDGFFIPRSFKVGDKSYLLRIAKIRLPDDTLVNSKIGEARADEASELGQVAVGAFINTLKKQIPVDFDKNLLSAG